MAARRRRGGAALVVLLLVAATASAAVPALTYPAPMHRPAATVSVNATLVPTFSTGALPVFTVRHGGVAEPSLFGFSSGGDPYDNGYRFFGWRLGKIPPENAGLLTSRERADLDFCDSVTRHLDASFHAAQASFLTFNNASIEKYGGGRYGRVTAQLIVVVGRDRRAAAIANVASVNFSVIHMPELIAGAGKSPPEKRPHWGVPTSALSNVGTPRRWAVVLDADGLPLVPAVARARSQKLLYPMCAPPEALVRGKGPAFEQPYYRSNLTSRGFHVRWFGAPKPYYALVGGFQTGQVDVMVGSRPMKRSSTPLITWSSPGSWRADRDQYAFCLTRQANILSAVQHDVRAVVANATVRSAFMVLVDNWYWQRAPAQVVFAQLADERLAMVFNRVNEFQQPALYLGFFAAAMEQPPFRCNVANFKLPAARTVAVTARDNNRPLQGVPLLC